MANRNFRRLMEDQWSDGNFVCVGLDIADEVKMRQIVDESHDLVCAYKLNTAPYEAKGIDGWLTLRRITAHIQAVAPKVAVIVDAKRGDTPETNLSYAKMAFEYLQADAITVSPYFGGKALQPFLDCADKGIIVVCHTSNEGAGELQNIKVYLTEEDCQELFYNEFTCECTRDIPNDPIMMPLYQYVAYRVINHWNKNGNCAVVAGATYPEELRAVREIVGNMPILIPGIGEQQKGVPLDEQVRQVVANGEDSRGRGMIINSSRGISLAPDPRKATVELNGLIKLYR